MPQVTEDNLVSSNFDIVGFFEYIVSLFTGSSISSDGLWSLFMQFWFWYSLLAFIVSGLLLFGILYAYNRANQLAVALSDMLAEAEAAWRAKYGGGAVRNQRWSEVQEHIESSNPNDWKLAIIEADIMLGKALNKHGFAGTSIGEQLKSASAHKFRTLQDAWDAHKVRNEIAHGGADFILTQKVARETIIRYQRVLQELGVV